MLDIEDDRHCCKFSYNSCRGMSANILHWSYFNESYRTLDMSKIPLRGQAVNNRTIWWLELKLLMDIEDSCNISYKSCRGMS